ncbi:hypothetical protein BI036_gp151 [Morganella phage vB_MmoM_MP1]|uniref:Uncharacterized protein n=1 Tax=Morganella phage vB_MmoM_MP1 TaxID=1852628 RepID=A0A192YA92_9CAUD|nr:hypothetical protein BI036_gp151 [Morganella phage vB_MmoM_MP1]ANM46634.1 hypothetical protein MP1_gp0243 [Morganella phage vB_MmoM_MP1]
MSSSDIVGVVFNLSDCITTINALNYKGDMIVIEIWQDNKVIAEGQIEISNNKDVSKEDVLTSLKRTVYVG